MPTVEEVLDVLQTALEDPSEVARGRLWAMTFVRELDISTLEKHVEEDRSLMPLMTNHLHLEHNMVRPIASDLIALTWNSIQEYIGDIERLRGLLVSESYDPKQMKAILYSEMVKCNECKSKWIDTKDVSELECPRCGSGEVFRLRGQEWLNRRITEIYNFLYSLGFEGGEG